MNRDETRRVEMEWSGGERHSNGKAVQRYATEWHGIVLTGPETEEQKYRAGRNPAERMKIWKT